MINHNIAGEEWEKEFDESFVLNDNNGRGDYFLYGMNPIYIKRFIANTRQEAIAGERKKILEDLDLEEQMPENFIGWTPEGHNNNLERFCAGYNACKEYVEWVFAGRPEPARLSSDTSKDYV